MKILEIARGPGDYWPGDEDNPRSPDYNPRSVARRGEPSDHSDYRSPQDELEDKRMAGAKTAFERYWAAKQERLETGEIDGKQYNIVVTFTATNHLQAQIWAEKWIDDERNIYMLSRPVMKRDGNTVKVYAELAPEHFAYKRAQK